jgi:hypothetical protein
MPAVVWARPASPESGKGSVASGFLLLTFQCSTGHVNLTLLIYDSAGVGANRFVGRALSAIWRVLAGQCPSYVPDHVFTRSNKNTLIGPKIKIGPHAMSMAQVFAPDGRELRTGGTCPAS